MAQKPDMYPVTENGTALAFLRDVQARFASHPSVYEEFTGLLTHFRKGETPGARAVVARAVALLHGQLDLVDRFNAFHHHKLETGPAGEDTAAASAATGEDIAAARHDRDRRRTDAVVDADLARAVQFIKRLKDDGDACLQGRVVALLTVVRTEAKMDAHEIHEQAAQIFGSAPDSDLLLGFIEYLPALHDLPRCIVKAEMEKQRQTRKRKAAAVAVPDPVTVPAPVAVDAGKPSAGKPSAAKKPRVVDDRKNRRTSIDGGGSTRGSGGGVSTFREAWDFETRYSKLVATVRRTKTLHKELDEPGPHAALGSAKKFSGACTAPWEPIQEALEDVERTSVALGRILDRLREKEDVAVKAAMERRDPARVRDRLLSELAIARRNQANGENR